MNTSSSSRPWYPRASIVLMLLCAGCGTNYRQAPREQITIAGQWQLQSPERGQLEASLRAEMERAQAAEEMEFRRQHERARGRGNGADIELTPPTPDNPEGGSKEGHKRNNWMARESRSRNDALLAVALPSKVLVITQSPSRIELLPENGARRRFDMGTPSTLVNSYATFHIESGWEGNVFIVQSRDAEEGIKITERYQRLGKLLQMQVQLKLRDAKTQEFTARYALQ